MSKKLCIPLAVLKQHLAVLGKTGKGKSSLMRYLVEYLLQEKKRVCIIDPKGDWWGIKSSADGKSAGFPVVAFGDFIEPKASDVPLNEHSGREVAQLVASGNRPCVIGFRGWTHGAMVRFWIDFAQGLFHHNAGELYVVGDEFHNFAPKGKVLDMDAGKCLHWSNRLLSEGRGMGLVCLIASQRPQKVHNDTLTCCETLVAMGVNHPADRAAVKDWIDGCGDRDKGNEVLNALAGLQRGEAYVWSPEIGYGPERVSFPKFETFDSFAPPQSQPKVMEQGWANVNLEEVKVKLAGVIEEAKANDPRELRRKIAELEKQLKNHQGTKDTKVETKTVEVPVIMPEHLDMMRTFGEAFFACEAASNRAADLGKSVLAEMQKLFGKIGLLKGEPTRPLRPLPASPKPIGKPVLQAGSGRLAPAENSRFQLQDGSLPTGEKAVLRALIQYPDGLRREQLTVLTGYKRSSRDAYLQRLREKCFIGFEGDRAKASELGIAALPDAEPLPTGQALQEFWLDRLPAGESVILVELISAYPEAMDREALSEKTNYQRSSRDAYLQRLKAKELIEDLGRGQVRASDNLFDLAPL